MNKTTIRVLSVVVTVFMLVSMFTCFAMAEETAAPFATSYNCAVTVDGVPQISSAALLVDTTITEEDGASVTRSWDGSEYSFVVGTNAFKTLEDAYAYAKAKSITRPDIIITGWPCDEETGVGADLTISAESNVYAPNWNTTPMNEMGDMSKVGVNSSGEDWTANATYAANEMKVGSITVTGAPANWIGVHGFTVTKYLSLSEKRSVGAAYVEILVKNCKMSGVETDSNILKKHGNTDANCKDVLTFQNFWIDTIGGKSTGASRFFGDGVTHTPNIVFDGLYIDFSKSDLGFKKTNDHIKTTIANTSLSFINSNLRRSAAGSSPYWNLAQNTGGLVTRELYYDNCTLSNTNQNGAFIYLVDGSWSKVSVTNNFVIATSPIASAIVPLFATNGSDFGVVTEETYTIKGNKLLGVKASIDNLKVPVPMNIEDNFTVNTLCATAADYAALEGVELTAAKGFSSGSTGSYVYDYDMTYASKIKIADVDFGDGSTTEIDMDIINVEYFGDKDVVTPVVTVNPDSAVSGEVSYVLSSDLEFTNPVTDVNVGEIKTNKIGTLYLRAYYIEKPEFETIYQIKILAATPIYFNDSFMESGFDFAGKKFIYNDTAIFVSDSELEDDGNYYGYGFLGDEYYKFKVDNILVFDSMSMLEKMMTGVIDPNVLLPGGEYGKFTFTYPANYYGTNADLNPVDDSHAQDVTGADVVFNEEWGKYSDTAFDTIYFADGLEGKIYFNGLTVRGQVNDTLRTMGKDGKACGSLDITFENLVVQHVRKVDFVDERAGGLVTRKIGTTTADKVFNLINTRSANENNSQPEFIDNQYIDIDYADFNEAYADSFTVKNLYVANMKNATTLFGEYVPAHMTIDNLYIDYSALGENVDNLIGSFKTGSAVKNGSFAFINSNIRNSVSGSTGENFTVQGPVGNAVNTVLPAGYVYNVAINGNLFYNPVHLSAAATTFITVAPSMLSKLEIKDNYAFQTGTNSKAKGFIKCTAGFENSDPSLAIVGNVNVDGNSFVGFDATDLSFNLGLGDNDPVLKNTFASSSDKAHLSDDLTGDYYEVMGSENYYLDFAKTVASTDVLITGTSATGEGDFRDVVIAGETIKLRMYAGTLADLVLNTNAGATAGKWSSVKAGTRVLNAKTVTVKATNLGKTNTYYYIYTYSHNGTDIKYSYEVKVEFCVDCTEHVWETEGTFNNDATCLTNGTQVVKCTTKGCIATAVVEKPDSKAEHKYENYVANNDATCVKIGTETGTCIWCGTPDTKENATLYPLNKTVHKWGEYIYNNDATCCKDGTETATCEYGCGAHQTRTSAEHLKSTVAHTWGEYTYDGTATCEKDGTMTAMCTVDGCRATNTIKDPNFPASDIYHVWGEYVDNKDATTLKDGTKTATCSVCGDKHTVTIPGTKLPVTLKDSANTYKDIVKTKWYKEAIDYVITYGFMNGTTTTEFGIGQDIDRGMFVTILARMAGVDTSSAANKAATTKFADVKSGKYYTAAVKWASDNGIVKGTGDTTFSPAQKISRQDLCVMIVRFAEYKGIKLTAKETAITFPDAAQISGYAKAAVKTCQMADIVNGHSSGKFAPQDTAKREEAAKILWTLHENFMK